MKPFRSIRWRLQAWYGLLVAGLLLAVALIAHHFERGAQLDRVDAELQRLAFELNSVSFRPSRLGATPPPAPDGRAGPRTRRPASEVLSAEQAARGFYYGVWTKNGAPFTASANAPANLGSTGQGVTGLRWVGSRREVIIVGNPGDIVVAGRDMVNELAELRALGWKIAGSALTAWVAMLLVGSWLVSRALQPIRDIGAAAQKIATGDLSQRINTRDTDSELGELAGVLNSTFGRLETSFAQQAQFTADAAHELRTPVTVMLTHVQNGLAAEGLTDEQREAFEACQRAAQRMRKLIESLLALARLDAGEAALKPVKLDLSEVAEDCILLVRPLAAAREIAVEARLEPAPCAGDAERLAQVITNLLANAIHYNRDGGEVQVSTRRENGGAYLVVADNGPGIASEHLARIFERFYRADKARTSAQGRTGLGLAISRAIVEAHGGTIEVESRLGQGATFTVRLPAEK